MIARRAGPLVRERLEQFPAVALLGPRQVGKTTLALQLAAERPSVYLDLERPSDVTKLAEPELYLPAHEDELVILDEVQRVPGLFQVLRGLIDEGKRRGKRAGRFLLLGSASIDLLQQSSESLAGRIAYLELGPMDVLEVDPPAAERLWSRGGFPESLLARDDAQSMTWRLNFIRTYLERDIPLLGPRVPVETIRRFWTMLAHQQGGLLNAAALARGLAVDGKTVARYLDLLVDLLLVRRLPPFHANHGKRLVKSPRVYIRDSGLVHALLGLPSLESLLGHPVVGGSWEGFVIENILGVVPDGTGVSFYRTGAGAEIDLVLELPGGELWAVEVKRSAAPTIGRGFHHAYQDLQPSRAFVVCPAVEQHPLAAGVVAIGLRDFLETIAGWTAARHATG